MNLGKCKRAGKALDRYNKYYENILLLGDFNAEESENI